MMGWEWGEAKHRERRSPMDTGGRKIDPKTGRPEKTMIERWLKSIVKPKGKHER